MRRVHDKTVRVEVTVIAESTYFVFVTVPPDRMVSIPKEFCVLADGCYPKNFELDSKTTLMVTEWFAKKNGLGSTAVAA